MISIYFNCSFKKESIVNEVLKVSNNLTHIFNALQNEKNQIIESLVSLTGNIKTVNL